LVDNLGALFCSCTMGDDSGIQSRLTNRMDDAFCARVRAAIEAGLESAPIGVISTPGTPKLAARYAAFSSSLPTGRPALRFAIWRAIYETKARCRHFRSCNTGTCSRATEWSAVKRTEANKGGRSKNFVQIITSDKVKTQAYCDLNKLEVQVKGLRKRMIPRRSQRSATKPRR